jgi:hypothetical protein
VAERPTPRTVAVSHVLLGLLLVGMHVVQGRLMAGEMDAGVVVAAAVVGGVLALGLIVANVPLTRAAPSAASALVARRIATATAAAAAVWLVVFPVLALVIAEDDTGGRSVFIAIVADLVTLFVLVLALRTRRMAPRA